MTNTKKSTIIRLEHTKTMEYAKWSMLGGTKNII